MMMLVLTSASQVGPAPAAELDMTLARAIFATNILGVMSTVKEFTPLVIATKGKIVNVSSVAGYVGCVDFFSSRSLAYEGHQFTGRLTERGDSCAE